MKKRIFTNGHINKAKAFKLWLLLLGMILSNGNLFSQCDPVINGENFSCPSNSVQYFLTNFNGTGLNPATDITWSLTGGGTIASPNGVLVNVDWTTPGNWQLTVAVVANANCLSGQFDTLDVIVGSDQVLATGCNDTVQVSLGTDCQAVITLDMLAEGNFPYSEDDVNIWVYEDFGSGDTIPDNTVNRDHINKYYIVSFQTKCGNTNLCWGRIFVEDKIPPDDLVCTTYEIECKDSNIPTVGGIVDFPLPPGASNPVKVGVNRYRVSGIDACSDVYIEYTDQYQPDGCPYLGVIYRKWVATDGGSGMSMCTDTIRIKAGKIDGTVWPKDWTGLPGDEPILKCDGNFQKLPNGHPHENHTGEPFGGLICSNIDISYNDLRLDICENSYKLLREWIAVDWCHDTIAYHTQVIKVLDEDGPQLHCRSTCADPTIVQTSPGTCLGIAILPVPDKCQNCGIVNVINECTSWSYSVKYKPAIDPTDCAAAINGTATTVMTNIRHARDRFGRLMYKTTDGVKRKVYEVYDLLPGFSWVEYTVTDACGNLTKCTIEYKVEEHEKPIAVCDLHTVVTLSNEGNAKAYAKTFDDGSHDNCQFAGYEVRRMVTSSCDDTEFKDHVKFCCEDIINNPIMVVLRVYDISGNFNECMVEVTVQDETSPELDCPKNQTVYCGTDLSDLTKYGSPISSDDCPFTTDYKVTKRINTCGVGSITRQWWLNKGLVSQVTCSQTIRVVQDPKFDFAGLIWPKSPYVRQNGCLSQLDPNDLPKDYRTPDFSAIDNSCHKIYVSHKDKVYNIVQGACFKILRTWTVHDDCTNKTVEEVQVIKVLNTIAPKINCVGTIIVPIVGNDCSAYVELRAFATDSCTSSANLKWSYELDLDSDGTIDVVGKSNDASGVFDYGIRGQHKVTFKVEDMCGNTSNCTTRFVLQDKKQPTPYCRNGIVTVVMEMSGEVELWASDFNIGSFDNCTAESDLTFKFKSNGRANRVFSCNDIANGKDTSFTIDIVVRDKAGNEDFCTTTIILQDNKGDACDDNLITGTIAGLVQTTNTKMVSSVDVMLAGNMTGGNQHVTTLNDGHFAFPAIPLKTQYMIVPSKDDDYLNGVSTRDLVAIQKHLLGISSFNTPYQFIAADANNSKSVSTRDISELRKLILGKTIKLKNNKSWRFVNKSYDFNDINDPFGFDENIQISSLDGNEMHNDFYAIKIGDVNGDVRANNAQIIKTREGNEEVSFNTQNISFISDEEINVVFNSNDFILEGMQFTLNFDNSKLNLTNIRPLMEGMKMDNFGLTDISEGYLRCSWNGQMNNSDVALFELTFHTKSTGQLTDVISFSDDKIIAEAYDTNENVFELNLRFNDDEGNEIVANEVFTLLQNKPNPFDQSTIVAFILPKDDVAQLKIYDVTGKVIKLIKGHFGRGYNEIKIGKKDLNAQGVLYYQLETREHTATRKMILMD